MPVDGLKKIVEDRNCKVIAAGDLIKKKTRTTPPVGEGSAA
jgi:hypothetical protein